jgi:membrane protein
MWMTSYNAIYGSFAALPLFLIWVQASWSILLLGAELSFTFQNEKRFDEERESMMISYDSRRKVMIAVMVVVSRAFRDGKGAIDAEQIRHELSLPARILSNALHTLISASMLNEVHRPEQEYDVAYAPARDITTLRVYDILQAVDNYGYGEQNLDLNQPAEIAKCCKAVDMLKDITDKSNHNRLIIELIDNA